MKQLFGRTQIFTDVSEITSENVVDVLNKAFNVHSKNRNEIQYLYDYYRGKTPILTKKKEVRPEINHQINENRANEIVNFKVGYCFGENIQYIRRGDNDAVTESINWLNDWMFSVDKAAADKELAEWMHICGTAYRMTLPPEMDDDVPVSFYTLDPRDTFVVYYNGLGKRPVMGVKYVTDDTGLHTFSVYTKSMYFEVRNGIVKKAVPHALNDVPIIEYPADNSRLGAFEIVLPLLDAINQVESNRVDDIEQYVNSIMAVIGAEVTKEIADQINEYKMMCLPVDSDAKYLSAPMSQNDTQTLVDSLYQNVLTICGMPNRNGGSSTSDTGSAVLLRDGWESAEARAKSTELMFKRSERQFLKLMLRILHDTAGIQIPMTSIEIKFPRRYSDNLNTKAQALKMLLDCGVAPEVAFATASIWNDPLDAYLQSKPFLDKWNLEPIDEGDFNAETV